MIFNSTNNLRPFGFIDEPLRDAVLAGTQCGATTPWSAVPSTLRNRRIPHPCRAGSPRFALGARPWARVRIWDASPMSRSH